MDLSQHWLARHSYDGIRARLRMEGKDLAARAWTELSLELPWTVEGIHWCPIEEPGAGPLPNRIWVLLLIKD